MGSFFAEAVDDSDRLRRMAEMTVDERWRGLVRLYGEKGDDELREMRGEFDELTEMAQGVLRDEMKRRGIWSEAGAAPVTKAVVGDDEAALEAAEAAADEDETPTEPDGGWRRFTSHDLTLGGVVIHEYESEREAALCQFLLERAKIQCVVPQGSGQVKVAPDDAERAAAVLERGASLRVMAEFDAQYAAEESAGGFAAPVCAKCGSHEVMLELNDAGNEWVCPDCGNRWEETVAVE